MGCIYVRNATRQTPDHIELNNTGIGYNCGGHSGAPTLAAAHPAASFDPPLIAVVERTPGSNLANSPVFYDENDLTIIWGSGTDQDSYTGSITFEHNDQRDYVLYIFAKSVTLMVASDDANEARSIQADNS